MGCWHRLSGAEGSPHRVPVGAPAGVVQRNRNETFFLASGVKLKVIRYYIRWNLIQLHKHPGPPRICLTQDPNQDGDKITLTKPPSFTGRNGLK